MRPRSLTVVVLHVSLITVLAAIDQPAHAARRDAWRCAERAAADARVECARALADEESEDRGWRELSPSEPGEETISAELRPDGVVLVRDALAPVRLSKRRSGEVSLQLRCRGGALDVVLNTELAPETAGEASASFVDLRLDDRQLDDVATLPGDSDEELRFLDAHGTLERLLAAETLTLRYEPRKGRGREVSTMIDLRGLGGVTGRLIEACPGRPANARWKPSDPPLAGNEAGVQQPVLLRRVFGEMPPEARSQQVKGWVFVRAVIRTDGSVGGIEVLREQPTGFGLAGVAAEAFASWRYKPAMLDGHPVDVTIGMRMTFEAGGPIGWPDSPESDADPRGGVPGIRRPR